MADPGAFRNTYLGGTPGTAIVNAFRDTGTVIDNAPVCELDLTVTVPGKEPYAVEHRQLIGHRRWLASSPAPPSACGWTRAIAPSS
jgi:hypothetical protein